MPLTNGEYVIFALVALFIGPVLMLAAHGCSALLGPLGCVFMLPLIVLMLVPAAVIHLMTPVLRACGRRMPSIDSAQSPLTVTLLFWPLTLAPVHFLSFRALGWPQWGFALLAVGAALVTVAAVCWHSR